VYFQFTPFNSVTLGVMLLTGTMIWARLRFGLASTWLLLYYAGVDFYGLTYRDTLGWQWMIGGTGCGVLLRFEFMGGWVLKGVRALEMMFFAYVLWRGAVLLMRWPW
jgi:hypothetical protein